MDMRKLIQGRSQLQGRGRQHQIYQKQMNGARMLGTNFKGLRTAFSFENNEPCRLEYGSAEIEYGWFIINDQDRRGGGSMVDHDEMLRPGCVPDEKNFLFSQSGCGGRLASLATVLKRRNSTLTGSGRSGRHWG